MPKTLTGSLQHYKEGRSLFISISQPENETGPPRNQEKFLQQQSSEQLERHTQWYQGDSKEWELSAKVQTAESDQMSRPTEQQPEQRRRSRAHPGPRCFLRGPTWAMGDYSTSKQVSKQLIRDWYFLGAQIKIALQPRSVYLNRCGGSVSSRSGFDFSKICHDQFQRGARNRPYRCNVLYNLYSWVAEKF